MTKATSPWAEPGAAGERLTLEDFPTFLFVRLASAMQRDVTAGYLADFELNAPQWRVLAALAAYAPIPFSELVKLSMSDKALVSRSLQALAGRGLAQVKADPDHGKKLVCHITAKGRALYQKVLPRAQAAQADILALLGKDERVALHATLQKLRAALDTRPAV
ncbi:MAG: winged helix-turn-helix transcriptional regulator [Burkholderiales bacterium]|nr:winged helix-turn-helix transcriptional regulator [Burkholderiales bacterium]